MPDRPPPRPGFRPGMTVKRDIVGPEEEDVTDLDPRQIMLRCYDATLHLKAGMRLEMNMLDYRLKNVEHHIWPGTNPVPGPLVVAGNAGVEWDRRRHIDPLSEFNPEDTDHGSTKLPPGMFQALQQKVTRLETEKSEADAYAAGQEDVRREIEKASAKRWNTTLKWIKVLVPLLAIAFGGVGFLVKHLIDQPAIEQHSKESKP